MADIMNTVIISYGFIFRLSFCDIPDEVLIVLNI